MFRGKEIDHNLDRDRIRKLLIIGVAGSVLTGAGDFLLGFAEESSGSNLASSIMSSAQNLSDWQIITGGLLGMIGILLEGLACFAIYRLMADSTPKYARIYKIGIIGYIWLAPVGCHLNMGILNLAYKYLLQADVSLAEEAAKPLIYGFSIPVWVLLIILWLPAIIIQFMAFAKGYTPYPAKTKWFSVLVGIWPILIVSVIIGPHTAWGAGIGTTFLSFGNLFMFAGLLAALPSAECFNEFRNNLKQEA